MVGANQGLILKEKLLANSFGLWKLKSSFRMTFHSVCGSFMHHILRALSSNIPPRYCFEFITTYFVYQLAIYELFSDVPPMLFLPLVETFVAVIFVIGLSLSALRNLPRAVVAGSQLPQVQSVREYRLQRTEKTVITPRCLFSFVIMLHQF